MTFSAFLRLVAFLFVAFTCKVDKSSLLTTIYQNSHCVNIFKSINSQSYNIVPYRLSYLDTHIVLSPYCPALIKHDLEADFELKVIAFKAINVNNNWLTNF